MNQDTQDTIIVLACIALIALFVILMAWPAIVRAEKVDVATGTYPTTRDVKGYYHIRGWVKNITPNETDTDFSVDLKFVPSNHAYTFVIGQVGSPTKAILGPGQTMYWDHATKVSVGYQPYFMKVRYNEFPFPPLHKQVVVVDNTRKGYPIPNFEEFNNLVKTP